MKDNLKTVKEIGDAAMAAAKIAAANQPPGNVHVVVLVSVNDEPTGSPRNRSSYVTANCHPSMKHRMLWDEFRQSQEQELAMAGR